VFSHNYQPKLAECFAMAIRSRSTSASVIAGA
jgi:hypothetical protein